MTIRLCGTCLKAEFADDDAEDDAVFIIRPGTTTGHLQRPSGSAVKSGLGLLVQVAHPGPRTYCGQDIGDDWEKAPRWS